MRWDGSPGAGFTTGEPWLPLGDPAVNVEAQDADLRSMLALHRELLALRRSREDLVTGAYATVLADGVLAYRRGGSTVVALNLTPDEQTVPLSGRIVLSTGLDRAGESVSELSLGSGEGVILDA
jgi:alpha-glucosidase